MPADTRACGRRQKNDCQRHSGCEFAVHTRGPFHYAI
jgi:hypothetical protein